MKASQNYLHTTLRVGPAASFVVPQAAGSSSGRNFINSGMLSKVLASFALRSSDVSGWGPATAICWPYVQLATVKHDKNFN